MISSETIPEFSLITPVIPNLSLMRRIPLSVIPYGSGQQQTWSRHSLTNDHHVGSGYNPWWPLCFHRINFIACWTVNDKTWSFVLRYFVCTRFDHRYPIPSSSSSPTNIFTRLCLLHLCDLVTGLQVVDAISPSGPRVPICHSDGQIPLWSIHTPQHMYFQIPKMHLYGYPITV